MKDFKSLKVLKKSAFTILLLFIAVFTSFALAYASGGGADSSAPLDLSGFLLKVINFSVLFAILVFFIRKPLKNFLKSRQDGVQGAMKDADDALVDATKEYDASEKKLKELAKEIDAITANMKHEGELEKERIIKRTEEVAAKIKAQTENTISREFEVIQKRIQEETIEQTVDEAEAILQDKFKAEDQDSVAQMIAKEISTVKDIDVFLQNPISTELKKKVPLEIDPSKQVSETTMDFIKVLLAADDSTTKNVGDIKKAFDNFLSDMTSTSKAQIYSATDISDAALNSITASLKGAVGKDIEIEVIKEPSIIGGIVTKIGSLVFDASVKTQLENMRENLKSEVG